MGVPHRRSLHIHGVAASGVLLTSALFHSGHSGRIDQGISTARAGNSGNPDQVRNDQGYWEISKANISKNESLFGEYSS